MKKSRPLHRRQSAGFSLVELLGVIAIILLMLTLTMTNLGSVGSSQRLANAGNLVTDLVNQGRQSAKSRNSLVMLALVTTGQDAGRVLTLLEKPMGTAAWQANSKWEILPDGIIVDLAKSADFVASSAPGLQPPPPPLHRGGATIAPGGYAYQIFLPDGRLLTANSTLPSLFLKKITDGDTPANYYKILINPNTGIPFIQRP